ncbi:MAG TPA: PilZ domain-containing protein [Pyrinomonadaceae bacterium]|nr:PilZ domain-containing protein [Pyrinomonadaceae bacterium]
MQIDRRAGTDRRAATRYRVTMDIEWEGPSGRRQGTLSDISTLGCFVLCSGDIEDGVAVKLFLSPADGINVELGGVVSNHLIEVGFAARFLNPSTAQQDFLRNFVEAHATD